MCNLNQLIVSIDLSTLFLLGLFRACCMVWDFSLAEDRVATSRYMFYRAKTLVMAGCLLDINSISVLFHIKYIARGLKWSTVQHPQLNPTFLDAKAYSHISKYYPYPHHNYVKKDKISSISSITWTYRAKFAFIS